MKKLLLTIIVAASALAIHAQELAPDQNPNYKASMEKYSANNETLQSTMNTTVHNTYKAYDWSTAKAERKTERRNFRRERALLFNYNNGFNNNYYNNGFYNNGYYNNYNNCFRYRRW